MAQVMRLLHIKRLASCSAAPADSLTDSHLRPGRGGGDDDVSEDDIREQAKGDYMEL